MSGSCLMQAIRQGNSQAVSGLIEMGIDISSPFEENDPDEGGSALTAAIRSRQLGIIQILLDHPDIDTQFQSPLVQAVDSQWSIVDLLIRSKKLDINAGYHGQETVLHMAANRGIDSTIKLLLAYEGDIKLNMRDDQGRAELSLAIRKGHELCVELLLGQSNIDTEMRDEQGHTPLSLATGDRRISCAKLRLAQNDIDVNVRDNRGRTPLSLAARQGHEVCVELLLTRRDVDVNASNDE